jgi:hypothetical protein
MLATRIRASGAPAARASMAAAAARVYSATDVMLPSSAVHASFAPMSTVT